MVEESIQVATKLGCQKTIYDVYFCASVCELGENEMCIYDPSIGDDVCKVGKFLIEKHIYLLDLCQYLFY